MADYIWQSDQLMGVIMLVWALFLIFSYVYLRDNGIRKICLHIWFGRSIPKQKINITINDGKVGVDDFS